MTPDLADVPLLDWWPVGPVLLVLVVAAALLAWRARRGLRRAAVATTVVLLGVQVAVVVNAHFDYYRTIGEAFGVPASDVVSLRDAERERGRVPSAGRVLPLDVPAVASRFAARPALVYLPPAWFAADRPTLPVIMLLHGEPGSPQDWVDGGQAQATADAWAAAHGGAAPVLVMPDVNGTYDGDTECVDSPAGDVETYLTEDVTASVTKTLGTRRTGAGWAVAGLSEGGSCALMLALRHPTLFGTFGDFSGLAGPRVGDTNADTADTVTQLFDGSATAFAAHEPAALLAAHRYPRLAGWFEVGDADPEPLAAISTLVPAARAAGIAACRVVVPGGGHTFALWSDAFARSLPWFAARLGLSGSPPPCPDIG